MPGKKMGRQGGWDPAWVFRGFLRLLEETVGWERVMMRAGPAGGSQALSHRR